MDCGRFILYLGDMSKGSEDWNERDLMQNCSCKT